MKKIGSLIFSVVLFCFATTLPSCTDDDPSGNKELGEITTAIYNARSSNFTITYKNGNEVKINATIDSSKTPSIAYATLSDGTIVWVSDATASGNAIVGNFPKDDTESDNSYVNSWIYKNMSIYYLWNDKLPLSPDYTVKPDKFFKSILYTYDKVSNPNGDRFSWIQESYVDLLNDLSGVSSDEIGFDYMFVYANEAKTQYYAIVLYPKKNTDAYAKGIKRGRFVTKVNGQNITPNNYSTLFGGSGSKTLSMADWVSDTSGGYKLTSSGDVIINTQSDYAENPVYLDSVYTIDNKKIGYLVYNFFATDKGDDSYSYDQTLMDALGRIKAKGATEMVLDLRYNSGGAVSSAIAMASALVKNRSTSNILITSEYNSALNSELKKSYGADYFNEYFIDKIKISNSSQIAIPAMNFQNLYVLTGNWTASASEMVINGLKPYMDKITLIGETTYGKNVGSISFYEKNDAKNKWGMQPIVVKFYNSRKESDFTAGFAPDYEIDEFENLYLYDLGNTNDPLLGKAIESITGSKTRSMNRVSPTTASRGMQLNKDAALRLRETKGRFEMYDDTKEDALRKLMVQ